MALQTVSHPWDRQTRGVITVEANGKRIRTCLASEIPDLVERLVAMYDDLPEIEKPHIVIWWHPEDYQRVFGQNGLRQTQIH